jgi:ABC-type glycerol-3-phosphate transport system substrate-binding protein
MKTTKTKIFALIVAASAAMAFTFDGGKASAVVDQKEGLHIFIMSRPAGGSEYLGSVKKTVAWSGKPEEMLNSMIKKVKKEYPKADGIIFTNVDMDKADAVIIK